MLDPTPTMRCVVLNLDREVDRWWQMQTHLAEFGISPVRWAGVDAGPSASRIEKSVAIAKSYYQLLSFLNEPAVIIQDDVRLRSLPPELPGLVVFNKPSLGHLCPKAFSVDDPARERLADMFKSSAWACSTMYRAATRWGQIVEVVL